MLISRRDNKLLIDALAYFLDHNEEIEFNDEEANDLLERLREDRKGMTKDKTLEKLRGPLTENDLTPNEND